MAAAVFFASAGHAQVGSYFYGGQPRLLSKGPGLNVLTNIGYAVGYDEKQQNALWVSYRLFDVENPPETERRDRFNIDPRTDARVSDGDFKHSGYTRGHLAPSYAMAVCYGERAQKEAYLLSNITPQSVNLNTGPWHELEKAIMEKYLPAFKELWVVAGPVFDRQRERIPEGPAIPDGCFKIIVIEKNNRPYAQAFLMPQEVERNADFRRFQVSIDRVEAVTGLDFLSALPDAVEDRMERFSPRQ